MTHPADLGKNNYNQVLGRGRVAVATVREALRRIVDESPGPQTTAMLLARAGLNLSTINEVLEELAEIGRKAKNWPEGEG